jgi:hypothetical protein
MHVTPPPGSISQRSTFGWAGALLLVLAAIVPAIRWFESETGESGLHGPVGVIGGIPLLLVFAVGSVVLAVTILRARVGLVQTLVGLVPLSLLLLGAAALALIALAG